MFIHSTVSPTRIVRLDGEKAKPLILIITVFGVGVGVGGGGVAVGIGLGVAVGVAVGFGRGVDVAVGAGRGFGVAVAAGRGVFVAAGRAVAVGGVDAVAEAVSVANTVAVARSDRLMVALDGPPHAASNASAPSIRLRAHRTGLRQTRARVRMVIPPAFAAIHLNLKQAAQRGIRSPVTQPQRHLGIGGIAQRRCPRYYAVPWPARAKRHPVSMNHKYPHHSG